MDKLITRKQIKFLYSLGRSAGLKGSDELKTFLFGEGFKQKKSLKLLTHEEVNEAVKLLREKIGIDETKPDKDPATDKTMLSIGSLILAKEISWIRVCRLIEKTYGSIPALWKKWMAKPNVSTDAALENQKRLPVFLPYFTQNEARRFIIILKNLKK